MSGDPTTRKRSIARMNVRAYTAFERNGWLPRIA